MHQAHVDSVELSIPDHLENRGDGAYYDEPRRSGRGSRRSGAGGGSYPHVEHQEEMYHDDEVNDGDSEYDYHQSDPTRRNLFVAACCCCVIILAIIIGVVVGRKNRSKSSSANSMAQGPTFAPADFSAVEALIRSVALQDGAEFENDKSYQSQSLAWVKSQVDFFTSEGLTDQEIIQRYALGCIYYATNAVPTIYTDYAFGQGVIAGWRKQEEWLSRTSVCADWHGITCNEENGLVQMVELAQNRLTGSFPAETTLLKESLERLDIFENHIWNKGPEGNDWLGELTNMRFLYYGTTNFEYDGIPPAIANLQKLQEYDCSFSLYFGELDGRIFAELDQLVYLVMGGNAYNSTIPTELYQLPNLKYLYLDNSFLSGTIEGMDQMQNIIEFWVDHNDGLGGTIPTEIGQLDQTLASFSITNCNFQGPIPTEMGQLVDMQQMWFYDNSLTGDVPSELGQMTILRILELYKNPQLELVPAEVCALRDPIGLVTTLTGDCDTGAFECNCCTQCY